MKILFISDIMGDPGRKAVMSCLPRLREKYSPALVVANGENAAGGFGLTPRITDDLFDMGIDLITSGNHIWDKKDILTYIDREKRLLRPANFPPGVPGYGSAIVRASNGTNVGVINRRGRVFMSIIDCPFRKADEEIARLKKEGAKVILVDIHAEATSEKIALARYLDGKVTAVIGTHTHVQTADEKILPEGTAYITDAGLTGPEDSVIGVTAELAISRFLTQMPTRFDTAKGPGTLQGVAITVDQNTGKATAIERISMTE
jgi:metallophosphoesterase (TIGR00282 family)